MKTFTQDGKGISSKRKAIHVTVSQKSGIIAYVKSFLLEIWPFFKFCFFTKISESAMDEASDYPKLTCLKAACKQLKRDKICFERLRFSIKTNESYGGESVILQPVRRRQSPVLIMMRAERHFILASVGFNYFSYKSVIFRDVWRGSQTSMLRAMMSEMMIIPEKYQIKIDNESKIQIANPRGSGGMRGSVCSGSSITSQVGLGSNITSLLSSGRSQKGSKQHAMLSDTSKHPMGYLTSGISASSLAGNSTLFVIEPPTGFSSAFQFDSDKEPNLKSEEFLYLLSAAKFVKYLYWDPLLLLHHDLCVKCLIIGLIIFAFLFSILLIYNIYYFVSKIFKIFFCIVLWWFIFSLMKIYRSEFVLLEFYWKRKMKKRDKYMRMKYEKGLADHQNKEISTKDVSKKMKRSESLRKSIMVVSDTLAVVYKYGPTLLALSGCILFIIVTAIDKGSVYFLTLLYVPILIAPCAFFSVNSDFIDWIAVLKNFCFQGSIFFLLFNRFTYYLFSLWISPTVVFIDELATIITNSTESFSLMFRFFAVYVFFSCVLEMLIYFNFFGYLEKITPWMSSMFGITKIEASYLLMSIFCNCDHMIKINSNLPTRLTKSELHLLLAAGLINVSLPDMCIYSLLGIPFFVMLLFNIVSIPGLLVISKLLYPEIQSSLETERNLTPKTEPITKQTRLVTDVWISAIAHAFRNLLYHVFMSILIPAVSKIFSSLLFRSKRFGDTDDIMDMLALIIQPLAFCLGIKTTSDVAFFSAAIIKRVFISDMLSAFMLSKRLHFYWTVSCILTLEGLNKGDELRKSDAFSNDIKKFLELFMDGDVYQDEANPQTLLIAITLICSYSSIPRLFLATSHLASILPKSKQENLTYIGLRAFISTLLCRFILAILTGMTYSKYHEIHCGKSFSDKDNRKQFCEKFLLTFPTFHAFNSTSTSPYGNYYGVYENHCTNTRSTLLTFFGG